jgi:hypothetical protein
MLSLASEKLWTHGFALLPLVGWEVLIDIFISQYFIVRKTK